MPRTSRLPVLLFLVPASTLLGANTGPADPDPALQWFEEILVGRDPASGLAVVLEDAEVTVHSPGPVLVERASGPVVTVRGATLEPGERLLLGDSEVRVLSASAEGQVILDAPLRGEPGDRLLRIDRPLPVYGDPDGLVPLTLPLRPDQEGRVGFYVPADRFEILVSSKGRTAYLKRVERFPSPRTSSRVRRGRRDEASDLPGSTAGSATGDAADPDRPSEVGDSPVGAGDLASTPRDLGDGGTGSAPDGASYVTRIPEPALANETALSDLPTGLIKNETGTGALSGAVQGVDFYAPGGTPVAEIDIDPAITRDAEWDSAAKINASTTDADFLVLDGRPQGWNDTKTIDVSAGASLRLDKTGSGGSSDRVLSVSVAGQERTFVDAEGRVYAFDGSTTGLVPHSGTSTTWTGGQVFGSGARFEGPGYVDPSSDTNALTLPQGPHLFFDVAELTAGGGPSGTGFTLDSCRANNGAEPGVWDNGLGLFYNSKCGMGRLRADEWAWGSYWETNWSQEVGDRWFEWNQDFVARDGTYWRPWYFVFDTLARGGEGALRLWSLATRRGGDPVLEVTDDVWPGSRGGSIRISRPPWEGASGAASVFRVAEGPVLPAAGAAIQGRIQLRHETAGAIGTEADGVLGEAIFDSGSPGTEGGTVAGARFRAAFAGDATDRRVAFLSGVRTRVEVSATGPGNGAGVVRGVDVETALSPGVAVDAWQGVSVQGMPEVPVETVSRAAGLQVGDLRGIGAIDSSAVRIEAQSGADGTKGNLVLAGGNATNGHLALSNGEVHVWAQPGADPPVLMVNKTRNQAPAQESDGYAISVAAAPTSRPVVARCGTAVLDPPLLAPGAAVVATASVPGVALGDVCACATRSPFADPVIPKSCRGAADQLRLRLYNASSEPLDPAPQSVDYCCWSK